ncbi:MAG: ABC transporter permease [Pseudomonadota bacterium]
MFWRRAASFAGTVIAASILIFIATEIAPGDAARFMMGVEADPVALEALRQDLGLNGPPVERYLRWIFAFLRGDLGISYTYRVPVSDLVLERLALSLPLAFGAMLLSAAIAVPGALLAAKNVGGVRDSATSSAAYLGLAIPNFWLAMLLVLLFAVTLQLFPAGGFPGWSRPAEAIWALVLPVIALGVPQGAILLRLLRASLIDTASQDFMRTARAKGLTEWQALRRHALPNALVPVLPIIGLQFAFLLGGAIVVESVFYLPGLGRLVLQAVTQRDLITVKAVVMVFVIIVTFLSFSIDIISTWLDPRLRRQRL